MLLGTEGVFRISIDCYDAAWPGHLELEVGIMRHHIESSKCGSSKQCVIALRKGTISKINSSLWKLSGDPKMTSSVIEPVQRASTPGMTPLKVVVEVGGQAGLGRQQWAPPPWLAQRQGYDPTSIQVDSGSNG